MTQDKRNDQIITDMTTNSPATPTGSSGSGSVDARAVFRKKAGQPVVAAPKTTPTKPLPVSMWIEGQQDLKEAATNPMLRNWLMELFDDNNPYTRADDFDQQLMDALEYYERDFRDMDGEDLASRARTADNEPDDDNTPSSSPSGSYDILARGARGRIPGRAGSGEIQLPPLTKIQIGERQALINGLLPTAAAAAGVSPETMKGIWYKESKFSSIKELSTTGCAGPWQFTRGTFSEMILRHGDEMARNLKAKGFDQEAALVAKYHYGMMNKSIDVKHDSALHNLRNNAAISTFAANYYVADIAKRQGLDAMDIKNGGKLYAAYNVGEGSLNKLERLAANGYDGPAKSVLGFVADVNPAFYKNGATAGQVLKNYQATIENGIKQHTVSFALSPDIAPNGRDITVAQAAAPTLTDRKPASRMDQILSHLGIPTSREPS